LELGFSKRLQTSPSGKMGAHKFEREHRPWLSGVFTSLHTVAAGFEKTQQKTAFRKNRKAVLFDLIFNFFTALFTNQNTFFNLQQILGLTTEKARKSFFLDYDYASLRISRNFQLCRFCEPQPIANRLWYMNPPQRIKILLLGFLAIPFINTLFTLKLFTL
jgi:hypothetical protein